MSNLSVDNLAIMALVGFGSLVAVCIGLIAWVMAKAGKAPGDL